MLRTLTVAQEAALAQDVTRPGILLEIALVDSYLRLSSRGTVTAIGVEWAGWDLQVQGLGLGQNKPSPSGTALIGDPNFEITALLLNAPRLAAVRAFVYTVEALEVDSTDIEQVFDGVLGEVSGGTSGMRCTVGLVSREGSILYTPRRTVSSENGFSVIMPSGLQTFNGEKYEFQPER